MKQIYYVTGFVCETRKLTVALWAEDEAAAERKAYRLTSISGTTTVVPLEKWTGRDADIYFNADFKEV